MAVYTKDHNVRQTQNSSSSYLQISPREIISISQNKKNFIISWTAGIYSISDFKDAEIEKKQSCIPKDLIETYRQINFTQSLEQYSCQPGLDSENLESIPFEEVKELKDRVWLKELNVAIDLKAEIEMNQNLFSPADQFCEKADFVTCKRKIRPLLKKQKLVSVYRTVDKFEDYIWLVFDSGRILQLYKSYHGYKIVTAGNFPYWTDLASLDKIPDEKKQKLNFEEIPELEDGYFLGTISTEEKFIGRKYSTRVYKLKFKDLKIRPGLILVGDSTATIRKIERINWTFYPILYPVSIGLDIATSPLQLLSIIVLGFYNHLWLGNCILKVSCKTPLG